MEALIASKRAKVSIDPELFAAYRTLAADADAVVSAHVRELVRLIAEIVSAGVKEGAFRRVEPAATARAILAATSRFHHPAHAAEWADPGNEAAFDAVWDLLMNGLRAVSN